MQADGYVRRRNRGLGTTWAPWAISCTLGNEKVVDEAEDRQSGLSALFAVVACDKMHLGPQENAKFVLVLLHETVGTAILAFIAPQRMWAKAERGWDA